jgi:hypothetical protein
MVVNESWAADRTAGFLGVAFLVALLGSAVVAVACLARLGLEMAGQPRGALDSLAPIAFLVLIAALTWLSFRGGRSRTV